MVDLEGNNQKDTDEAYNSSLNEPRNFPRELREEAEYLTNTTPSMIREDALMELEYLLKDIRNFCTRNPVLKKRVGSVLSVVSHLCDTNKRIPKAAARPVEYFDNINFVIDELMAIADLIGIK